jgi:hypothetical protein
MRRGGTASRTISAECMDKSPIEIGEINRFFRSTDITLTTAAEIHSSQNNANKTCDMMTEFQYSVNSTGKPAVKQTNIHHFSWDVPGPTPFRPPSRAKEALR